MRTFVLNAGQSYKFWNIAVQDNQVRLAFGQVGTNGRSETRTFATAKQAQQECDKLIKEKTYKGYVETTQPDALTLPQPVSLRDTLERAIIEDPADLASYAAYADWLSEQSAPADLARGELIRLQLALEDPALAPGERDKLRGQAEALIAQHQQDWVGPWIETVVQQEPMGRGQLDFAEPRPVRYVRGLPAEVAIGYLSFRTAATFVSRPESWLVRKLFIGGFAWEEPHSLEPIPQRLAHFQHVETSRGVMEALKQWPGLVNLRAFQLGWTSDEEYGDFCHFQCHLSSQSVHELVAKMPRLEELYLFVHHANCGALFTLPMPNLRVLQVYHSPSYPLERLAENASLTNLTHLLFHPHAFEGEVSLTLDGLRTIARSPHLQSLTHLRLRLTVFGDEGIREIIDSGLLGRLKVLDLRHGRVSDEGARLLAACPEVKNLEMLDLSRNELTAEGATELLAMGVPLRSDYQHASTAGMEEDDYGALDFLAEGDYE